MYPRTQNLLRTCSILTIFFLILFQFYYSGTDIQKFNIEKKGIIQSIHPQITFKKRTL